MKLHHVHSPATVGELKELIAGLPDGMELGVLQRGYRQPIDLSLQLRGKGKPDRAVSRGGVPFLAVTNF